MASIISDPNGRKRIQFAAGDGSRKTIRLGKATMKQAIAFKAKVEALIGQTITGIADDEVSRWLAALDDHMYGRLVAIGLVKSRAGRHETLGKLVGDYIVGRTDTKPRTIANFRRAEKCLIDFFGAAKPIRQISQGDAADYWRWLLGKGYALNHVRRLCGRAKQFLAYAIDKEWITRNPFKKLKTRVTSDPKRKYFISRDVAQKVIEACPDAEWRLIFALCRYGGLRCPSEIANLRWIDVDWSRDRFTVHSPKTEHHEGKATRIVPIFPELYPYLRDAFELAKPGTEFVIARTRDPDVNLRTQLKRILSKAGVEPWPKLFVNLRSSRETELAEEYPLHVVVTWIGNSERIAQEHYLQVTEDHYQQAAQNAAQSAAELACLDVTASRAGNEKTPEIPLLSTADIGGQDYRTPPRGLEPLS